MKLFLKCLMVLSLSLLINAKIMVFHKADGGSDKYSITDVKKITFELSGYQNRTTTPVSIKTCNGLTVMPHAGCVKISLARKGSVNISLFDIKGRFVKSIHRSELLPGEYIFPLSDSRFAQGMYFVTATLNNQRFTKQFVKCR